MQADAFFRMGSTHAVCQDYATHTKIGDVTFVAVADGCSSSPDTDFGARLLTRAFAESVEQLPWQTSRSVALAAQRMSVALGLPKESLDSTLLTVTQRHDEGPLLIQQFGDGAVLYRSHTGWHYESVDFDKNAPNYPRYSLCENDSLAYNEFVGHATITRGEKGADGIWKTWSTVVPLDEHRAMRLTLSTEACDVALVMTDGVHSFQDAGGMPVPVEAVLDELIAFKGYAGQFVARRCMRFLDKTCAERGWKHADDFAVAGIYVGEAP